MGIGRDLVVFGFVFAIADRFSLYVKEKAIKAIYLFSGRFSRFFLNKVHLGFADWQKEKGFSRRIPFGKF